MATANDDKRRVAVIGLSCSFAGADNAAEFWHVIKQGQALSDMETRFPNYKYFYSADRTTPGKSYVRHAGFLKRDIYGFDADFFEISDKEAYAMDVQQRVLLETAHEALEDAGIVIRGTDSGVFIGAFMCDWMISNMGAGNVKSISEYSATGQSLGILSSRISYFYDLNGPSMTIDTACSSSLTALHYAYCAIRENRCETALCGGVNLLTDISLFVSLCKGGFVSDRCKAFETGADGYARGEGVGVLVLKNLDAAIRDGDRIYCEVLGSRISHDGRKQGIFAPKAESQTRLLRAVYDDCGVPLDDVSYIEAHGTGTLAGDAAETKALGEVFAERTVPLAVGTAKACVGHTESAAGMAGVIKGILVLQNQEIPAQPLESAFRPDIPVHIKPVASPVVLPKAKDGNYYIGISSFGFGGSNAHVVITGMRGQDIRKTGEQKPDAPEVDKGKPDLPLLVISARSEESLRKMAKVYADFLENGSLSGTSRMNVCAASALRREHFEFRLAAAIEDRNGLAYGLRSFAEGNRDANIEYGRAKLNNKTKTAVIFSGMGVQNEGMGAELYAHFFIFKAAFDRYAAVFKQMSGIDMRRIIQGGDPEDFYDPAILQPYNLAYQLAMLKVLESFGIKYDAVAGHSVGELAAFCCAGALSEESAFQIAYHRGRLQSRLRGMGGMLAVGIGCGEGDILCKEHDNKISVAAVNGTSDIVLSGEMEALLAIKADMDSKGVFNRLMDVDVAYHSSHMDMVKDEFLSHISGMGFENSLSHALYSTVKAGVFAPEAYTKQGKHGDHAEYGEHAKHGEHEDVCGAYWWENMRNTVKFYETITEMRKDGYEHFIEIGASRALGHYISGAFSEMGSACACVHVQNRNEPQAASIYRVIARMYCAGFPVEWSAVFRKSAYVDLPKYQWDRKGFKPKAKDMLSMEVTDGSLLGRRLNWPLAAWEVMLNLEHRPFLSGHATSNGVLFPAAGYIVMMQEAGIEVVTDFSVSAPVWLYEHKDTTLMTTLDEDGHVLISSSDDPKLPWIKNCRATIASRSDMGTMNLSEIKSKADCSFGAEAIYAVLREKSLFYRDGFIMLSEAHIGEGFSLCGIRDIDGIANRTERGVYMLDAMLQSAAFAARGSAERDRSFISLPSSIEKITLSEFNKKASGLFIYSRVSQNMRNITGDSFLLDGKGQVLAAMTGIVFSLMRKPHADHGGGGCYSTAWEKLEIENSGKNGNQNNKETMTFFAAKSDASPGIPQVECAAEECARLVRKVRETGSVAAALTVVTSRALKVLEGDAAENYWQSALWGLGRTVRLEYGNIKLTLIDDDGSIPGMDYDALAAILGDESELAIRSGEVYGLRITEAQLRKTAENAPETVLITGASGGLGYRLALRLAQKGTRRIALMSRHYTDTVGVLLEVLRYYGIKADFYAADVTNYENLKSSLINAEKELGRINAVYHLAGVIKDMLASGLDLPEIREVFEPKATGAVNLCALPLAKETHFYFISSAVGLLGNAGQGAYAAANTFLHGFCDHLAARSIDASVVGFGALDVGMTVKDRNTRVLLKKKNLMVMDGDAAIALSERAPGGCAYIMEMDWPQYARYIYDNRFEQLTERIMPDRRDNLRERLDLRSYEQSVAVIEEFLLRTYAEVLEKDNVDPDRETRTMGIDSLNSIIIASQINDALDIQTMYHQTVGSFSIREMAGRLYAAIVDAEMGA